MDQTNQAAEETVASAGADWIDDFQNDLAFLGIESSPAFVREPEGNGCIERYFRTLKDPLLWVRHFQSISELVRALVD